MPWSDSLHETLVLCTWRCCAREKGRFLRHLVGQVGAVYHYRIADYGVAYVPMWRGITHARKVRFPFFSWATLHFSYGARVKDHFGGGNILASGTSSCNCKSKQHKTATPLAPHSRVRGQSVASFCGFFFSTLPSDVSDRDFDSRFCPSGVSPHPRSVLTIL